MFIPRSTDPAVSTNGQGGDILNRNALTTAGVLVGAGAGVAGAAILVAALPGQAITAGVVTGGLLYAGNRQFDGKSIIPGMGQKQDSAPAAAPEVTDGTAAA